MPVTQTIETEDALEILADHCMAARVVIEEAGTAAMRQLIDLLLYEVGLALAKATPREVVSDSCD